MGRLISVLIPIGILAVVGIGGVAALSAIKPKPEKAEEARAGLNVGRVVAGVHIGDGGDHGGPEKGQEAAQTAAPSFQNVTHGALGPPVAAGIYGDIRHCVSCAAQERRKGLKYSMCYIV